MKPSVTVFSNTFTAGGLIYVDLKIDKANAAAVQLFNAYGAPIVNFGGSCTGNTEDALAEVVVAGANFNGASNVIDTGSAPASLGIYVGMLVSGTHITAGTTVTAVVDPGVGWGVEISLPTEDESVNATVTFTADTSVTFTLGARQIELQAGATVRQTFDLTLEDPTADERAIVWPKVMATRIAAAIQTLADKGDPPTRITATTLTITPD